MRIETYWEDTVIYMIQFSVIDTTYGFRKIRKTIILKEELPDEKVSIIVREKFRNVLKIDHIEIWGDALFLKKDK